MKKFKIAVSKANKKYTLVLGAETEELAKQRVHDQWYSILGVEEYTEDKSKHRFYFSWLKDGNIQKWQIIGDDIFKVYVKLRRSLWYTMKYIYSEDEGNISEEKKWAILKQLEEEFDILKLWNKKTKSRDIRSKIKQEKQNDKNLDNFYMKKELDETYALIDFILEKIEKLISNTQLQVDAAQRDKLKTLYNSIIKIKKSTNIAKLKEVGERALIKVWEIELRELEKEKGDYIEWQLKETNKLLKDIGSNEQFIEKEKDIKYIIANSLAELSVFFKNINKKKKKEEIDIRSHLYIKNKLFLKKYKEKLSANRKLIIKNIFSLILHKTLREEIFLKRKVIIQNITILEAKQKGVGFSYTSVAKWYNKIIQKFLVLSNSIQRALLYIIVIFSFLFILSIHFPFLVPNGFLQISWILYFIFILFIFLVLYTAKNLLTLVFNFVIFAFLSIFFIVNF